MEGECSPLAEDVMIVMVEADERHCKKGRRFYIIIANHLQ